MPLRRALYVTVGVAVAVAGGPLRAQTPTASRLLKAVVPPAPASFRHHKKLQASYDPVADSTHLGMGREPMPYRRVSWPLLDIVTLPDPCMGFRMIVAPATGTTAWRKGSQVVQFGLDPVEALQWAGLASRFAHSDTVAAAKSKAPVRYLPAIRPARGHRILLVADYGTGAKPDRRFVLVVSDSSEKIHYKTFASSAQLDDLARAVEASAELGRQRSPVKDTTALTEDMPAMDTPVELRHVGQLKYPLELWRQGRVGRVWMQYVVNAEGRVEEGSFQTVLSDDQRFTDSVVRLLRETTFQPATAHGVPVRQRVFQVFSFVIG